MAWTAGLVRYTGSMDSGARTHYVLRVTHVYRREGGAWRIAHQHSDFEQVDQRGDADSSPEEA
jgi:ketosteroid isomerase-like protein